MQDAGRAGALCGPANTCPLVCLPACWKQPPGSAQSQPIQLRPLACNPVCVAATWGGTQDALIAKLQPGSKDSPINDGLYSAINIVDVFLHAHRETDAELEALKAQVKRAVVERVRGPHGRETDPASKTPAGAFKLRGFLIHACVQQVYLLRSLPNSARNA